MLILLKTDRMICGIGAVSLPIFTANTADNRADRDRFVLPASKIQLTGKSVLRGVGQEKYRVLKPGKIIVVQVAEFIFG